MASRTLRGWALIFADHAAWHSGVQPTSLWACSPFVMSSVRTWSVWLQLSFLSSGRPLPGCAIYIYETTGSHTVDSASRLTPGWITCHPSTGSGFAFNIPRWSRSLRSPGRNGYPDSPPIFRRFIGKSFCSAAWQLDEFGIVGHYGCPDTSGPSAMEAIRKRSM